MPRAKVRCGSIVSPAEKVTYCQPSYAHSTPIIPVTRPLNSAIDVDAGHHATGAWPPGLAAISVTASSTITPALIVVATPWTSALRLVPRTFSAVTTTIVATEAARDPAGDSGTKTLR